MGVMISACSATRRVSTGDVGRLGLEGANSKAQTKPFKAQLEFALSFALLYVYCHRFRSRLVRFAVETCGASAGLHAENCRSSSKQL